LGAQVCERLHLVRGAAKAGALEQVSRLDDAEAGALDRTQIALAVRAYGRCDEQGGDGECDAPNVAGSTADAAYHVRGNTRFGAIGWANVCFAITPYTWPQALQWTTRNHG
jgi:hypothetical protein